MNPQRVETLPCWRGPVTIEPLGGGITNRNYLVTEVSPAGAGAGASAGAGRYVARICADRSILGIDRANERSCQAAAAALGVAPPVHYSEPGILVSPFLEGRVLSTDDFSTQVVRPSDLVARISKTLRQLHDGWDQMFGEFLYFCPFATARTYAARARKLGASMPAGIDALLADARNLQCRMAPFRPTLCHNDLLPANLIDSGEEIWLIDWEYGGMGHPFFDLAGLAGNCMFEPVQEACLLATYLGRDPAPAEWIDFRVLKSASLLRESLWAVLQTVAAELQFDYSGYAADNLARYAKARAELDGPPGRSAGLANAPEFC